MHVLKKTFSEIYCTIQNAIKMESQNGNGTHT